MNNPPDRDELNDALRRCGSSWSAAQAHGLLCSRLAVLSVNAGVEWLRQVLEGADASDSATRKCASQLETLFTDTQQKLTERQSEFTPLLPGDDESAQERAQALAHWCEGFLHGLVSDVSSDRLKKCLAEEPLCDIIRDLLEMTRAAADDDVDDEDNDSAYAELVEYLRVAAQLTYEELAEFRGLLSGEPASGEAPPVLH